MFYCIRLWWETIFRFKMKKVDDNAKEFAYHFNEGYAVTQATIQSLFSFQ